MARESWAGLLKFSPRRTCFFSCFLPEHANHAYKGRRKLFDVHNELNTGRQRPKNHKTVSLRPHRSDMNEHGLLQGQGSGSEQGVQEAHYVFVYSYAAD